ncbi:hypothetical protein D7Y23_09140 [Corallococcus sp. AB050B]|nr:hypothetical protein D7Y23_09140 [Corallococcus sp. AB050B]
MDFDEALRELGVDADPGDDTVRRTYLRKLKTRKPETDPEGFARLRAAYETVLARREGREGPRTQAAPWTQATQQHPQPGAASATVAPIQDALTRFRAEFWALPPDAPPEVLVDVARRAVEAVQDAAEPRRWLVAALLRANRDKEALAACRDAYRQGHAGFLLELAQRFPRALEDAEIELLGRDAPHRFLWRLADQLLDFHDVERAWKVARVAFERTGSAPTEPPPPHPWFVNFALLMHLNNRPGLARELVRRYVAWMDREGRSHAFESGDVGAVWPLVLELGALPDTFNGSLRRSLVRLVLDQDLEGARFTLRELERNLPQGAVDAIHALRQHAPKLNQLLGAPMLPRVGNTGPSPERLPGPVALSKEETEKAYRSFKVAMGVVVVVALLAVAVSVHILRMRSEGPSEQEQWMASAQRQGQVLCEQFRGTGHHPFCVGLRALVARRERGDCTPMDAEFLALRQQLGHPFAPFRGSSLPASQERQRPTNEDFTAFEQALGNVCQGSEVSRVR